MDGPDSSYSCLEIHICWKVERDFIYVNIIRVHSLEEHDAKDPGHTYTRSKQ